MAGQNRKNWYVSDRLEMRYLSFYSGGRLGASQENSQCFSSLGMRRPLPFFPSSLLVRKASFGIMLYENFIIWNTLYHTMIARIPRWFSGKEFTCQDRTCKTCVFDPWVGKIYCRRNWQTTSVFLPGKSHGQRSLVGCNPWVAESNTTEWLSRAW